MSMKTARMSKRGRSAAKSKTGSSTEKLRKAALTEIGERLSGKNKSKVKAAAGGKRAERTPKRVSLLDAAAQVLAASDKPMRTKEMVEAAATKGLWSSPKGKTPEATLAAAIGREIKENGPASRFRKVDRGQFIIVKRTG